jgi:hypothetical protein
MKLLAPVEAILESIQVLALNVPADEGDFRRIRALQENWLD